MGLIEHRESLVLKAGSQQFEMLIPSYNDEAVGLKNLYLKRKGYEYEAVMVALFERICESLERPVFLDLGANIGFYSLLAGKLLGDKGEVYAIESNPQISDVLQASIDLNGLSQIKVVRTALSDRVETVRSHGNELFYDRLEGEGFMLESETCDAMCTRLDIQPNMAKMDVHGFEGKMLGGMKEVLAGSLQYLLTELHPNIYLERYTPGITRMMILDMLEEAGFKNYYVAGHRYTWSDGMRKFFETGKFAYQPLTRETRGMLLFDRHNHVFVLSSKRPLEDLIGPSILDPSAE